jgi:DNA-binding GntR family transcriptional regulator
MKSRILERKLLPGDKIYQDRLAEELGVSRTPLVNALKYLVHEKLIEAVPRIGYFVRQFTKEEMISIFELREVLEGLAARRAAILISDAQAKKMEGFFGNFNELEYLSNYRAYAKEDRLFHGFVVEVGSKEFLRSILESYNVIAFSYQIGDGNAEGLVRSPVETIMEHQAIIKAIVKRNPDKAEELMRMHLRKSCDRLRQDFREKDVPR